MSWRRASLSAAIGLMAFATQALAGDLTGGGTVTPDAMANPLTEAGFSVLAETHGTFSSPVETGTYSAYVVKETSGTLDFVYQFANDSTSTSHIERMTAFNFANFTTNVGYVSGTGDVTPSSATRTTDGKVVGFNFLTGGSVSAGQSSDILVIKTNATEYTTGTYTFQNGGATTVAAYAPALATPEPSSLLSAGLGGIVLLGIVRRRRLARA